MKILARAGGATRCGPRHVQNEDRLRIFDGQHPLVARADRGQVYVVCDGVSSTPKGGQAAALGVERVGGFFDDLVPPKVESLVQLVSEIDWELREERKGQAACTLALLWLEGTQATVLHVGDSPVYRVRHGEARLVSRKAGKGGLSTFLGMGPRIAEALAVWQAPLYVGDLFFLVTDGVTEVLSPSELVDAWWSQGGSPERVARALVDEVERRSGQDDATVVVVDVLAMEGVDSPGVRL